MDAGGVSGEQVDKRRWEIEDDNGCVAAAGPAGNAHLLWLTGNRRRDDRSIVTRPHSYDGRHNYHFTKDCSDIWTKLQQNSARPASRGACQIPALVACN